jgi:hypothetical protein
MKGLTMPKKTDLEKRMLYNEMDQIWFGADIDQYEDGEIEQILEYFDYIMRNFEAITGTEVW